MRVALILFSYQTRRTTMDRLKRAALVTKLVDRLREENSWCGETHVQKAVYFLQALFNAPTEFEFILYKHGPFSFDLRDELTSLRADEVLALEVQLPYGPRIFTTERGKYLQNARSKTIDRWQEAIEFVAKKLGKQDVVELERLATALFVTSHATHNASVEDRAEELIRLKSHIQKDTAMEAIMEVDVIVRECPA